MTSEKPKVKEHWYLPEEAEKIKTSQTQKELDEDVDNGLNERDPREWPYGPFHPHAEKPKRKKSSGG